MQHKENKPLDVVPETITIAGIEYNIDESVDIETARLYLHRARGSMYQMVHHKRISYQKRGNGKKAPLEFRLIDLYRFRQNELRYIEIK